MCTLCVNDSGPSASAMSLWPVLLTITIQFSRYCASSDATHLILVAADGRTTGRQMQRSNALHQYTILLIKPGQDVQFEFSTNDCNATVSDIRYSNGGSGSDVCTVSIDEIVVGTFTTSVQRLPESYDPWNDFVTTGQVGSATVLCGGSHTLQVTATRVDPYGMEMDYVQLSLECDGVRAAATSHYHNVITTSERPVPTPGVITTSERPVPTPGVITTSETPVPTPGVITTSERPVPTPGVITTSETPVPTGVHPINATGWRAPESKPIKSNSKLSINGIAGICVASIVLIAAVVTVSVAAFAAVYYKKYKRRYFVMDNDLYDGGYIDYGGGNDDGVRG